MADATRRLGQAGYDPDWVLGLCVTQIFDLLEEVVQDQKQERHDGFLLTAIASQGDNKGIKKTAKDLKT